jgi:hypothetical protein
LLNNAPLQSPSPAPDRLAGIARVVRQICLLREQGELLRATRLQEDELPAAVRDLRLAHGPEVLAESELRALFAAEERRVGDAVILAELLLPRLVGNWPASSAGARPPVSLPPAASRGPAPAGSVPAIPDLLDAMLAAERTGRRPAPAVKRES